MIIQKHPRVKKKGNYRFKKKLTNNSIFKMLIYKKAKKKLIYIYKRVTTGLSVVKLFKHTILSGLLLPRTHFHNTVLKNYSFF